MTECLHKAACEDMSAQDEITLVKELQELKERITLTSELLEIHHAEESIKEREKTKQRVRQEHNFLCACVECVPAEPACPPAPSLPTSTPNEGSVTGSGDGDESEQAPGAGWSTGPIRRRGGKKKKKGGK